MQDSTSRRRRRLLAYGWHPSVGALATGAGLALMFPVLAQAADECGAATGGAVNCAPGAYPTGITYAPTAPLTLTLQQSAAAAPVISGSGISITTTGGDFSLVRGLVSATASAPAPSITSSAGAAISVTNAGTPGDFSLDLSSPTTDSGISIQGATDGVDVSGGASTALTLINGSVTATGAGDAIGITTIGAASISTGLATLNGGGGVNFTQTGPGGGAISVTTGAGSITATAAGSGNGISVLAQGVSSDPITVTTGGGIRAHGTGVLVDSGSAQATTITTNAAISAGSDGVSSSNAGTGSLTTVINANILADSNNGGVGDAVRLSSQSGAINLTTAAGITLTLGSASPPSARKDFLSATSTTGTIAIDNAANLINQGATGGAAFLISGIFAASTGGAVNVSSTGVIGLPANPLGGDGIDASASGGVGALTVDDSGAITVAGKAIDAATAGTGDVNVTLSGVVRALNNSAIVTSAVTGQTNLTVSANVAGGIFGVESATSGGAVTLNNSAAISGLSGGVVDVVSAGVANPGTLTINNSAAGHITGGGVASTSASLQFTNASGVQINNDGLINTTQSGHAGYALSVTTQPASSNIPAVTIANSASGTIDGALVNNTAGSTILDNAGAWYTANRVSSFGAANIGAIVNSGLIQAVIDSPTAALSSTQFTGLATLTNTGTVSLSNGLAGDSLTISGNYIGGAGSVLKLDISGATADELHIAGSASGHTTIVLNTLGNLPAVINTPLVTTGAASSPGAFGLPNGTVRSGLTQLGIVYSPTTNVYSLVQTLNPAAFETTRFAEIRRDAFYRSQAAWTSHLDQYRTADAERDEIQEGIHPWASAYGGGSNRSGAESAIFETANVGYNESYVGVQVGFDVVEAIAGGSAVIGAMAGYTDADGKFDETNDQLMVNDFNIGVYAAYMQRGWFFNALAKFDPGTAEIKSPYASYQHSLKSSEAGLSLEAGKRIDLRRWYIEPEISITGVRGSVSGGNAATASSDYSVQGLAVNLADDASLRGRVGARAGMSASRAFGGQLTPYVALAGVDEFTGADKASFGTGAGATDLKNTGLGAHAEARLGADLVWASGLTVSLEGNGSFGGNLGGGGGQMMIRLPW